MAGELSRRDFFTVAAAGFSLGLSERPAEAQDFGQNHDTQEAIAQLLFRQDNEKLEIPTERREPNEKVLQIVQILKKCQQEIDDNPPARDATQRRIWGELRPLLKNLKEYSETAFYEVLINEIPKILVHHNIYVRVNNTFITDSDRQHIRVLVLTFDFHKINKVVKENVTLDGAQLPIDVVHTSPLPVSRLEPAPSEPPFTANQNILINDEHSKKISAEEMAMRPEQLATLSGVTKDAVMARMEQITDPREQNRLGRYAAEAFLIKEDYALYDTDGEDEQLEYNRIISHEAGHVKLSKTELVNSRFAPRDFRTVDEYIRFSKEMQVYSEALAFVTEIKLARNKTIALANLFLDEERLANEHVHEGHIPASLWLREEAAKEVVEHAAQYGLTINSERPISPRNQALLHFDNIAKNRALAELLADRLLEKLGKAKDLKPMDVSAISSIPSRHVVVLTDAGPKRVDRQPDDDSDDVAKWGIGGLLTALAAYGLVRLSRRRQAVAAATRTEISGQGRKGRERGPQSPRNKRKKR